MIRIIAIQRFVIYYMRVRYIQGWTRL